MNHSSLPESDSGREWLRPYVPLGDCSACHDNQAWRPAPKFNHSRASFSLTGLHQQLSCKKCHAGYSSPSGESAKYANLLGPTVPGGNALLFKGLSFDRGCQSCHADPHQLNLSGGFACETCHTPTQWWTLLPFDHSGIRSKLDASHLKIANSTTCIKCHEPSKQKGLSARETVPVFSSTSVQCSRCHAEKDPHGGQFGIQGNGRKECASCHAMAAWSTVRFDHSNTRFVLDGAHRKADCTRCHKESDVNGKKIRLYRDTPFDCLNCH